MPSIQQATLDVAEFMRKAGQEVPVKPKWPADETLDLRMDLILEEVEELGLAITDKDFVKYADGIIDLLYVVIGAGLAAGLNLEPFWQEVQRSNMSKFIDGYRREDGKWIKGPSYTPADLAPILEEQQK